MPGQNFVYVHLNRVIKKYDQDMILISGPGHGGNFFVANAYLDGTYSEVYPQHQPGRGRHETAVQAVQLPRPSPAMWRPKLRAPSTRAASWAIPLPMPSALCSITPDLICAVTVGDGEAETGPWPPAGSPTSS